MYIYLHSGASYGNLYQCQLKNYQLLQLYTMKHIFLLIGFTMFLGGCSFTDAKNTAKDQAPRDTGNVIKKSYYIDLMEKILSAYSTEHIDTYFAQVKQKGLTEHGFPRLTANIGILIAHGRRTDLKDRFTEMMDLCCRQIPRVRAANEFSVKEIIFCLDELGKSKCFPTEKLDEWKNNLRSIDPAACYSKCARKPEDNVHNWAAFGMVSEYMRKKAGLTSKSNDEFIDLQAYSQLRHLDSNQMYRDPACPPVYEIATRGLFAQLLHEGYQGKYKDVWMNVLENTALPTLNMLSVTGEMPAGGRSNQFLHNEAMTASLLEFYANLYFSKGDKHTAGMFRAAAIRALQNIASNLENKPITHIKNRFPIGSRYGCERYAYFDKYMITAASGLYTAYRMCNDAITPVEPDDDAGMSWKTSDDFHFLFLRAGSYTCQYDYDAYTQHKKKKLYDCNGVVRLHKKGAPSEICLSVSCPQNANYTVDIKNSFSLAIAPGVFSDGAWSYATESSTKHTVKAHHAEKNSASAVTECKFPCGKVTTCNYTLNRDGLQIEISGEGKLRCLLPAFRFNGAEHTNVLQKGDTLRIEYRGFVCIYKVKNGTLKDLKKPARNRNGHYDTWAAEGNDTLKVQISIEKL